MEALAAYGGEDELAETKKEVVIDGSVLEGGGQILRISLALAAILGQAIRIHSIRKNRAKPGLASQHAAGIKLCASMCHAATTGVNVGSTEITFRPGRMSEDNFFYGDAVTAGSTMLLAQASLPIALLMRHGPNARRSAGPVTLDLRGGTNAEMAPQVDYFQRVFLPFLKQHMGIDIECKVIQRGFYPRGGGHVQISLQPLSPQQKIPSFQLKERGDIAHVDVHVFVAGKTPPAWAERAGEAVRTGLEPLGVPIRLHTSTLTAQEVAANGAGSSVLLLAHTSTGCTLAGSAIGKSGTDPGDLAGKVAIPELSKQVQEGGCVDEYLQDQLIIFMVLAKNTSLLRTGHLTLHTRTAIHVAEQLTTARFEVSQDGSSSVINCKGAGL